MAQVETDALVLEAREYRETSLLATLLTRDCGRVGVMVRGARRKNSPLAAAMQSFTMTRVRLLIRERGGLATLLSADSPKWAAFARPGGDLAAMAYAGLFAEVLTHSHENDPHGEELFELTQRFFSGLSEAEYVGSFALRGYFALLSALGFGMVPNEMPEPCEGEMYRVDLLQGVVKPIAPGVATASGLMGRSTFALTAPCLAVLKHLLWTAEEWSQGGAEEGLAPMSRGVGRPLVRLAAVLFEAHIDTTLRSMRFLEEMVLQVK